MKRIFCFFLMAVIFVGCSKGIEQDTVITIDDVKITASQFEQAFQRSRFAAMGEKGRKAFLDNYVSRKLILKEAERLGLDKDPQFLNDIQLFWEKALLKLVLLKKSHEFVKHTNIPDAAIAAYYQQHKDAQFTGKDLSEVREQIKWTLLQEKQNQAMGAWAADLKKEADIDIDYKRLGVRK